MNWHDFLSAQACRIGVIGAGLAAAFIMLSGCGPAGSQPFPGMPPPEVNVVTVLPKTEPVNFEYTGLLAGYREVEVRARVGGILLKRNFTEGGNVARGQSLYSIDAAPFESALARADADFAGAEARLAQARRNAARLKPLIVSKAASQKELDDAVSSEQIAEADLKAARARHNDAKLNLEYTKVEAPIAGVAGRSQRSEGTLVSGPDVLLTSIVQMDPIYVNFGIPEAEQLKLQRETDSGRLLLPKDRRFSVSVRMADGTAYPRIGRMSFSDVRVNERTGTGDSRAELPNPEGRLRPGQFVRVTLAGASRPNAILVPQRAVLEGPKGKFVYIVNAESKVEPRPVEVGEWSGDAWVINSGLVAGDKVVVDGVMKIGPGAPVRIADPDNPNAAPKSPSGGAAGGPPGALPGAKRGGKPPAEATTKSEGKAPAAAPAKS
ncbi:MAG: efflux RND transporter periplasmic adaptor subunit [Betaproteobacteria bacterium]|nr:efflux RND transporter periplasmic adaptor subunit [Betaproteobacteria bacterium]